MPTGVVRWVDPRTGDIVIARRSHEFPARAAEVEVHARRRGARVHFDVSREDGVRRAVRVRLRSGSRTGRRHRRVGDHAGAHHPYGKGVPLTKKYRSSVPVSTEDRPARIVRDWVTALRNRDVSGALELYAVDAIIHSEQESGAGRQAARRWLVRTGLENAPPIRADLRGRGDDTIAVNLQPHDGPEIDVVLRVTHGRIEEQWTES
jgi:ketosteroid isomerase-like protein